MDRTRALLKAAASVPRIDFFRAVCMDAAEGVDADKTSVWTFDAELSHIECQTSYDAITREFGKGQVLLRKDFPTYFRAIVEDNVVSAPQAWTHPVTKEFTEAYFKPNGIVSLLDFILHDDSRPYGVICCENRRGVRNWSPQDKSYLRSIAALTSFLFLPAKR